MAHAPRSVTFPVTGAPGMRLAAALGLLLWAGSLALWAHAWRSQPLPGAWWVMLALGTVLAVWAFWQAAHAPTGQLTWVPPSTRDGAETTVNDSVPCWRWESQAYRRGVPLVQLRSVLDLSSVQLLRASTAAGLGLWLWVARGSDPGEWGRLREAVRHGHRV